MPDIKSDPFEEDEWEDVPERDSTLSSRQSSVQPSATPRSVRKRKAGVKSVYVAQTTRKSIASKARSDPTLTIAREEIQRAALDGASFTTEFLLDVFSTALRLLRKPLGVLLFIWLLGILFTRLSHTFHTVFSPFCIIPGISRSAFCYIPPDITNRPKWANYSQLADMQSATFEQLLDESVGGTGLSLEIKKAEMATSDLITLVRVSHLTSRELLAEALSTFVEDAKTTGRGLQRMSAKIGGAVDSIMAVNDYAMHAIEAANDKPTSLITYVWPFGSQAQTKEIVLQTFGEAMNVLASQMERIILEAELNLASLDRLEQHLITIHDIVAREDVSITSAQAELLAQLWTKLGSNKRNLRGYDRHLALLKNLGAYRTRALAHVAAALQTLQALSADMEELRERAAAPEIVGERIPVEVHMKSIKGGIERLKEGRMKAREREAMVLRSIMGVDERDAN